MDRVARAQKTVFRSEIVNQKRPTLSVYSNSFYGATNLSSLQFTIASLFGDFQDSYIPELIKALVVGSSR